jgi:hypothetical protein
VRDQGSHDTRPAESLGVLATRDKVRATCRARILFWEWTAAERSGALETGVDVPADLVGPTMWGF